MDIATTAAIVAVTVSVMGGATSGYAALKQRQTESMTVVVAAMRDHMNTLSSENGDLRTRVHHAESRVTDLIAAVNRCEADKNTLAIQVEELRKRVTNGGQ